MAACLDDFSHEMTFTITGRGKTQDAAKKDFETKFDAKIEEAKRKLNCEANSCLDGEFGGTGKSCLFDYAEVDEQKCVEVVRKLKKHRRKRKRWECTQTFEVGCFCIGDKDEDED
jgi:hypothetical protein